MLRRHRPPLSSGKPLLVGEEEVVGAFCQLLAKLPALGADRRHPIGRQWVATIQDSETSLEYQIVL